MSRIRVHGSTEYDIIIENGLLAKAGSLVRDELDGSRGGGLIRDELEGSRGDGLIRDELGCTRANDSTRSKTPDCAKALIVTDSNVASLYLGTVAESFRDAGYETYTMVLPAGEQTKDIESYTFLLNILAEHEMNSSDLLVALGGGVVGDLVGFAAATFKRGMKCVQIPTSLLAAVDSSVGGKNAINLQSAKNQVGTIRNPSVVLCDPELIKTLPESVLRDGWAEIIKYGILNGPEIIKELRWVIGGVMDNGSRDEATLHETLDEVALQKSADFDADALSAADEVSTDERMSGYATYVDRDTTTENVRNTEMRNDYSKVIEMAVRIKRDIVEMDEGDQSFRQYLNLGHLIGHGIEAESEYRITHGEAVAAGLVLEARCCAFCGYIELTTYMEISELVESFGFELFRDYSSRLDELLPYIMRDKRIRNGRIQILVPYGIGDCNMREIPAEELAAFLRAGK